MRLNSDVEFKTWWNSKFAVKKTFKAQNEIDLAYDRHWTNGCRDHVHRFKKILYLNKTETEFKNKISLQIHRQSFKLLAASRCSSWHQFSTASLSLIAPIRLVWIRLRILAKLPRTSHPRFCLRKSWNLEFQTENSRVRRQYRYYFQWFLKLKFFNKLRLK